MEHGTRRILHHNVTAHPTADWTLQQVREALSGDHHYRFVIHDRDSIYSRDLDKAVAGMEVRVLRTPVRSPQANAICERLVGTLRRECLDFIIPISERHLKRVLRIWVAHYNQSRPHMSLGPGILAPLKQSPPEASHRHRLPAGHIIRRNPILGGLHHEYWLEKEAA
jgi:transposase InsO family protein